MLYRRQADVSKLELILRQLCAAYACTGGRKLVVLSQVNVALPCMCGMMGICLASPWPLLKLLLIVEKVVGLSMSGVWSLLEWYVPGHAMCVQSVGMLHCKWTVRVVQDRDASLCSMPARHSLSPQEYLPQQCTTRKCTPFNPAHAT